ncbi:J domain-containing protein [Bdellovibrio reynosensis]|uniref:J domain-containing protein n=1 Tax=Bdellovibrio reynosensis TaxID=2835041 RepID=A0ABY4CG90_9BACT|nr:J domain-containing protein [Bdellovibrio reynosensis]UOF02578.1 J domain-containing protein [Bdellovibrio reynosensis]
MSFQASFKQILREKMGENTSSSSAKMTDPSLNDPAHMAYLLGKIGRLELQTPRGQYPAPKVRPQRKPHSFNHSQRQAYEFMKSWIHDLNEGFTANELKKAFRQAAIILHPDHGGNTEQFIDLKAHYETLKGLTP